MSNSCNGKINEEGMELKSYLKDQVISLVTTKKNAQEIFKLPINPVKLMLEKSLHKELNEVSFVEELAKYYFIVDFEANFYVEDGGLETYGEDADGNRGITVQTYEDVNLDALDFSKIELRLIDENGDCLGGEDNFIDAKPLLSDKNDAFKSFVADMINNDLDRFID